MTQKKKKVLLIGWDAADWKVINKLMDNGEMPAMESLVDSGIIGNLQTLEPMFSPMLWTSIATGKHADKHGIHGFSEPLPDKMGVRPISGTTRKVKALWNMLMHENYKVHNVSWWPSHPAEPINGISVSNHYQQATTAFGEKWPMMPGTIHPPEMSKLFADLRMHPQELTQEHIIPFVPLAGKIDQEKEKGLTTVAKILSECTTVHNAATWIMENEEWDFLAVYHDAIDHFSHGFMDYNPPKMDKVPQERYELYKGVVEAGYKYHDMMLGRMLELTDDDTYVILISDHGFHSDHLRPKNLPDEPAAPAMQHRQHGIICVKGPGIKKDDRIYGATLLDITPTILSILDLPVGEDMDGKPLMQIFEEPKTIKTIPSWEHIEGECGMHQHEIIEDPVEAQVALKQLIELGYIEDPGDNVNLAVERTSRELRYNLAMVYMGSGRAVKAIPLFKELYETYPEESRFGVKLAICYKTENKIDECKKLIEQVALYEQTIINDKESVKRLKEKSKTEEGLNEKDYKEVKRRKQAVRQLISLDLFNGELLLIENKAKEAVELFLEVNKKVPNQLSIFLQLGGAYFKFKKWEESEKYYQKALEIDPHSSTALLGIGNTYFRRNEYYEAIDFILRSIGLIYFSPQAHFQLGNALYEIEEYEKAAQAFQVCLLQNPNMGIARNLLIEIYEKHLNKPEEAKKQKDYFTKNKEIATEKDTNKAEANLLNSKEKNTDTIKKDRELKNPITVVSGLPRSGTSMMMQMLEAGGMEIFTDKERKADESNPKGYYEHEAVKTLARNNKWITDIDKKAVKIISQLLMLLPHRRNYKIVFMLRNITEVVTSQQKMLLRTKKAKTEAYPLRLDTAYQKNLEKINLWAKRNYNVDLLYVEYQDVINNPSAQAKKVNEFLNTNLDIKKMASTVDKKLYREKVK